MGLHFVISYPYNSLPHVVAYVGWTVLAQADVAFGSVRTWIETFTSDYEKGLY